MPWPRLRLDEALARRGGEGRDNALPDAVVVDVDETVLDNSPYQVSLINTSQHYTPETWHAWVQQAAADSVPGAPAFLRYADMRGCKVWYITNRSTADVGFTFQNLKRLGFPIPDPHYILARGPGAPASKELRRQQVQRTHNLVLLIGDQLSDFTDGLAGTPAQRNANLGRYAGNIGQQFIVLPNAMYGDWLTARMPKGPANACQADSARRAGLRARVSTA